MTKEEMISKIEAVSKDISDTERLRENAKGQKEIYEQQLDENNKLFKELGVDPNKAQAYIDKLETEIANELETIQSMLPNDILAKSRASKKSVRQ